VAARDKMTSGRGIGTPVAEYSELGPFHCEDCVFAVGKTNDDEGLCNEKHMLKDNKVKTHKESGLKIVNLETGCCRFVKPPEKEDE